MGLYIVHAEDKEKMVALTSNDLVGSAFKDAGYTCKGGLAQPSFEGLGSRKISQATLSLDLTSPCPAFVFRPCHRAFFFHCPNPRSPVTYILGSCPWVPI